MINDATPEEIMKLPILRQGEFSTEFLHIIHAATKMAFHFKRIKVTPVLERNWEISRRYMAANLFKIKHWKLIHGDYTLAPDVEACWFIDPPYKGSGGEGYRWGSKELDYGKLASWVMKRRGQVICCEGHEGDYLPFEHLVEQKGVAGKVSKERIYYSLRKKSSEFALELQLA